MKNFLHFKLAKLCFILFFITASHDSLALDYFTTNHPDSVYTFSYHHGPAYTGLRMAYSVDMNYWIPIGNDYSFVKSDFGSWGDNKKMYNPNVIYDNGIWFTVWSVNNKTNQFATTTTTDYWTWKPQDYPYILNTNSCLNPFLTKEGNTISVYFKSSDDKYYVTTSNDFKHWSEAKEISHDNYLSHNNLKTLKINGEDVSGSINKVPYSVVENLIVRSSNAQYKARLNEENFSDDLNRFANVNHLSGILEVSNKTKFISSNLIGIFFEDISFAADGGLYAELIQNRDFEYSEYDRKEWNPKSFWEFNGVDSNFDIETSSPIHANNKHYAVITNSKSSSTLTNKGFDGILLKKGEKYDFSFFTKYLTKGKYVVNVKLVDDNLVIAETSFKVNSPNWNQQSAILVPNSDTSNASLQLEIKGKGKIGLDFISLFPQNTFKSHPNGLRQDLAQVIADLHPKFVRFPGGCVTHGNGLDNMYRWKETIGPLWERKGQFNIWNYHQSKGLGFYEYFQFCEDIGAEPLPVLPAGVCCQNSSVGGFGQQGGLPMNEMDEYAQEFIDLIEWANGDPQTSELAKIRANAGHPKPFNLKMIGVGNEDLISDVFTERYIYIKNKINAVYPDIKIIGTVGPFFEGSDYEYGWEIAKKENFDIVDEHYYNSPGWFIHNQDFYDKYDRTGPKVYLGEWASRGNKLENALVEALHITNLERNADVVVMSSYAPLLAKHGHINWNPDLIFFNNSEIFPSINYYVQQLCAINSGSQYVYSDIHLKTFVKNKEGQIVESRNSDVSERIKQSVVIDENTGDMIIKLVNITPCEVNINIKLNNYKYSYGYVDIIQGNPNDSNLKPLSHTFDINDLSEYKLNPYSINIIRLCK